MKKMTKQKTTATIKAVEYYNTSYYGNPSKVIAFEDWGGCKIGRTAPNSSAGYAIGIHSVGREYEITYRISKSGHLLIDYAKEI